MAESVFQKGVATNVDVEHRMVEFVERQSLMIHPAKILVPFAVLKAVVGNICIHEAQIETGGGIKTTVEGTAHGGSSPKPE